MRPFSVTARGPRIARPIAGIHTMRTCAGLAGIVVLLVLTPSIVRAQNTVSDGVQALVRGDYSTAVRILRPLAEDEPQPDPLAQFFLAMLYASGSGVAINQMKACGLYLASARPDNPLADQASSVARHIQAVSLGPMASLCAAGAERERGLAPVTFELAADHRVAFDEAGVTVTYRDVDRRIGMSGFPGSMFLPVQHIELTVSNPFAGQRHFFQVFMWYRSPRDPGAWSLGWTLIESAMGYPVVVSGDPRVTAVTGTEPPASFDPQNAVRLSVGQNGEAEWTIPDPVSPRRGVIPVKAP
jgi:hypothetical protein